MRQAASYLLPAALLVMCACSPTPVPGPTDLPSTAPDRYDAPEVQDPRDVRPFAATPCTGLLNAAQLQELGFSPSGRGRTDILGEQVCTWVGETVDQSLSVSPVPNRDILAGTYRARLSPIFEPITVGGLPAVREQSSPTDIICTITVGTAEDQGFVVDLYAYGTGPKNPCGQARRVAEGVVANLPPLAKN